MITWITALFFITLSKESMFALPAPRNMTAAPGGDVTIICEVPQNVITLHCRRTEDLEKYVVVYRNGKIISDEQHPSFTGRMDLQIRGGNSTLTLKNVTDNDSGTYECRVKTQENMKTICTIHLKVTPPDNNSGGSQDGGVPVFAKVIITVVVVVLIGVVILLWTKCRNPPCTNLRQDSSDSCTDTGNEQSSVV